MNARKLVYNTQLVSIYVGDIEAAEDQQWLDAANITDGFNLTDIRLKPEKQSEFVSWYNIFVDDDEILPEYRKQTIDKVEKICSLINKVKESNIDNLARPLEKRTVLLFCETGKLASVFVAGYYIINHTGFKGNLGEKVYELQRIYFTSEELAQEKQDIAGYNSGAQDTQLSSRIAKRKDKLCLLNLSYRVLLDPSQKKSLFYD